MVNENLVSLDVPPWNYIISTAMRSPSGDNCQPWFFEVNGLNLNIKISSDLSNHFMNQSGFADWISLGCIVESIYILCSSLNWNFELKLISKNEIVLNFFKSNNSNLHINEADLINRSTYRGEFSTFDVNDEKKLQIVLNDYLEYSLQRFPQIKFHYKKSFTESLLKQMEKVDILLWNQSRMIGDFLAWLRFSILDWSQKKDGFHRLEVDVKLFDVPILFAAQKINFLTKILKYIFPQIVKLKTKKWNKNILSRLYVSSHNNSMESLIDLGRAALVLWTTCTKAQFAVQPITMSTLTACEISDHHYNKILNKDDIKLFSEYYQQFKIELETNDQVIWGFRVGLQKNKNLVKSIRRDLRDHLKLT